MVKYYTGDQIPQRVFIRNIIHQDDFRRFEHKSPSSEVVLLESAFSKSRASLSGMNKNLRLKNLSKKQAALKGRLDETDVSVEDHPSKRIRTETLFAAQDPRPS